MCFFCTEKMQKQQKKDPRKLCFVGYLTLQEEEHQHAD